MTFSAWYKNNLSCKGFFYFNNFLLCWEWHFFHDFWQFFGFIFYLFSNEETENFHSSSSVLNACESRWSRAQSLLNPCFVRRRSVTATGAPTTPSIHPSLPRQCASGSYFFASVIENSASWKLYISHWLYFSPGFLFLTMFCAVKRATNQTMTLQWRDF